MDAREYEKRQTQLVHNLNEIGRELRVFGDDLGKSRLPEQQTVAGIAKSLSCMSWMMSKELCGQVKFSKRVREERLRRKGQGKRKQKEPIKGARCDR